MKRILRSHGRGLVLPAVLLLLFCAGWLFPSSISNGSAPSGAAGGDLSGTYPNPTVAGVNGAAVPLSAAFLGSNGARQLISVAAPTTSPVFTQTNSVTASMSGSFQTLTGTGSGSTSLAANYFASAGQSIHVFTGSAYTTGATAGNFTPGVQIFGVTFSGSAAGLNNNVTAQPWRCEFFLTALTVGGGGTMLSRGVCQYWVGTATAVVSTFAGASQVVNTTLATTFNFGITLSAAGNSITDDNLQVNPL